MAGGGGARLLLSRSAARTFKAAVLALARVGAELTLDARAVAPNAGRGAAARLTLRAIDGAKATFMSVAFKESFFDQMDVPAPDEAPAQAAVLTKSVAAALKAPCTSMEWTLPSPTDGDGVVTLVVACANGLLKTYHFPCLDCRMLSASVDGAHLLTTELTMEVTQLKALLAGLAPSMREVTFAGAPEVPPSSDGKHQPVLTLSALADPVMGSRGSSNSAGGLISTCLTVGRQYLSYYKHEGTQENTVSFSVAMLRVIADFCDALHADLGLKFSEVGMPMLCWPVHKGLGAVPDTEAQMVLATSHSNVGGVPAAAAPPRAFTGAPGAPVRDPRQQTLAQVVRNAATATAAGAAAAPAPSHAPSLPEPALDPTPVPVRGLGARPHVLLDDGASSDSDEGVPATPPHKRAHL